MAVRGRGDLTSALVNPQELLSSILECVAQPVWVVQHDGSILFANPAALSALGYAALDELLGKPSHETIHCKIMRPGTVLRGRARPTLWHR